MNLTIRDLKNLILNLDDNLKLNIVVDGHIYDIDSIDKNLFFLELKASEILKKPFVKEDYDRNE